MQRIGLNIGRGIVRGIKRGVMAVGAVVTAGIVKSLQTAGEFQKYEAQFEALIGSADEAKKRIKEIEDVALTVTFDVDSLTQANRHLTVFTENAMAGTDAMKMIADAASVTPNAIEDVAFWFGRAYSMIDAGRPMGEAVMRLREMSLISSTAAKGLAKLEKSYSPTAQAQKLQILIDSLMRFEGANKRLIKTLPGQMSMFRDAMTYAFRDVGNAIAPLTQRWLEELITKIRDLRDSGTFKQWGENVSNTFESARATLEGFFNNLSSRFGGLEFGRAGSEQRKAFMDEVEKLTSDISNVFTSVLRQNLQPVVDVGVELGFRLAKGFASGFDKELRKSKGGAAFLLKLASGFYIREVMDVSSDLGELGGQQVRSRQQRNRMMESFGRKLQFAKTGKSTAGQNTVMDQLRYRGLAQRAYNDPEWARKMLERLDKVASNTEKTRGSM
jgi:hypothetical protein